MKPPSCHVPNLILRSLNAHTRSDSGSGGFILELTCGFLRMDGTPYASLGISRHKARVAAPWARCHAAPRPRIDLPVCRPGSVILAQYNQGNLSIGGMRSAIVAFALTTIRPTPATICLDEVIQYRCGRTKTGEATGRGDYARASNLWHFLNTT